MTNVYPLQYTVPETTTVQILVAVGVLLALALVAAVFRIRMEWRGMDSNQRANAQAVVGELLGTDPVTDRFGGDGVVAGDIEVRQRVETLLDRAREGERGHASATPLRVAIAQAWGDVVPDLPTQVVRLGRLAVLVAVFGPLAVSTSVLVRALRYEPGGLTISEAFAEVADALLAGGDAAVGIAGAFPYAGAVWAIGLTIALTLGQWLYAHWYVVLALLVGVAAAVYYLADTDVWDGSGMRVISPIATWTAGLGGLLVVWGIGAGLAAAGAAMGVPTVGRVAGLMLSAVVAVGLAFVAVRSRWRLIRERSLRAAAPTRQALAAVLARATASTLIVVAAPLAVAYVTVAVIGGRGFEVVGALLSADPLIQTGVLLVVGLAGLALAATLRGSGADIRQGLRAAASRLRSRGTLFVSVGPLFAGALLYIGLTAAAPLPVALVVSVVVVVALRVVGRYANRARYAAVLRESEGRTRDVVVEMWAVADADGRTHYVADVGGTDLAHADRERFVDAVCEVIEIRAGGDRPGPMVERDYYDRLTDHGIADPEEIRDGQREYARTVIENALRDGAGRPRQVSREWFDERVSEVPQEVRAEVLREMRGLDADASIGEVKMTSEVVELRPDKQPDRRQGVTRVTA